jgi:hypothetical protein
MVEADAGDANEAFFKTEAFCPLLAVVTMPGSDLNGYLRNAVAFCNDRLAGNLAANVIVDATAMSEHRRDVDEAVATLRYGCVGVNVWSGVGFLLPALPWARTPDIRRSKSAAAPASCTTRGSFHAVKNRFSTRRSHRRSARSSHPGF